jgi:predicted ribosomally synthesized peptide with nif11-like leader
MSESYLLQMLPAFRKLNKSKLIFSMAFESITSELVKIKADEVLLEKIKGAADLDSAVALAQGAGYNVSKEELLNFKNSQDVELNDEALEGVAGGGVIKEGWDDVKDIVGEVGGWY